MPRPLRPADVIAEQSMEATALVAELRQAFAALWTAAQASGRAEVIEEARRAAPHVTEAERISKRIAELVAA